MAKPNYRAPFSVVLSKIRVLASNLLGSIIECAKRLERTMSRVRAAMLVVALVGLAFGIAVLVQRRGKEFEWLSTYHRCLGLRLRSEALGMLDIMVHLSEVQKEEGCRKSGSRNAQAYDASKYHAALALKYHKAAKCPWIPVAPDPPLPPLDQSLSSITVNPADWVDPYDPEFASAPK